MNFENELHDTLHAAARDSQVPTGLAERLVANARDGRTVVRSIGHVRRTSRLTVSLIASAAVVLAAGGITAATVLAGSSSTDGPAGHLTPTVPGPSGSGRASTSHSTSPARPSASERPSHVANVPVEVPAPTDFQAADVDFRDAAHATAFGVGDCASAAADSRKVTLIATDDGGASWHKLGVPAGLHSMFPTTETDGSCENNGDVLGPCVNNVLFVDDQRGYLYGLHGMYWTADGGAHWADQGTGSQPGGTTGLAVLGDHVFRIIPNRGSSPTEWSVLQEASLGSNTWNDVTPPGTFGRGSLLTAAGDRVYLAVDRSTPYVQGPTSIMMSADLGSRWTLLSTVDQVRSLVSTPDGRKWAALDTAGKCVLFGTDLPTAGVRGPHGCAGDPTTTQWYLLAEPTDGTLMLASINVRGEDEVATVTVYRSTDSGGSYSTLISSSEPSKDTLFADPVEFNGELGWLSPATRQLQVTDDSGDNWHIVRF